MPPPWPKGRFEWSSSKLLNGIEMITFGLRASGWSGDLYDHYEQSDLNVAIGDTMLIIPYRTDAALSQPHAVTALANLRFLGVGDPEGVFNTVLLSLQQLDGNGQWLTLGSSSLTADYKVARQTVSVSELVPSDRQIRLILIAGANEYRPPATPASGGTRTRVRLTEAMLDVPQCVPDLSTGACIGEEPQ